MSDLRWKDDDERDVSYLYRENEILGCVRNYAPIAKKGEEWQAYRSPMHATYHPDKETAKAALLNALQAVPAQTLTVEEERR